jgi:hypothetical protein
MTGIIIRILSYLVYGYHKIKKKPAEADNPLSAGPVFHSSKSVWDDSSR